MKRSTAFTILRESFLKPTSGLPKEKPYRVIQTAVHMHTPICHFLETKWLQLVNAVVFRRTTREPCLLRGNALSWRRAIRPNYKRRNTFSIKIYSSFRNSVVYNFINSSIILTNNLVKKCIEERRDSSIRCLYRVTPHPNSHASFTFRRWCFKIPLHELFFCKHCSFPRGLC